VLYAAIVVQCSCVLHAATAQYPLQCALYDVPFVRTTATHLTLLDQCAGMQCIMLTSDALCLLSAAAAAAHCTHTNRAVIGTYDDHDSGWNNGDSRTPRKAAFKEMFLDAIGEPRDSPRHARHFCTSCI
jgi:hypothetical protein